MAHAFADSGLRSPLAACMDPAGAPEFLRPLFEFMDATVVRPLKSAEDDVAWADALDRVLPTWRTLRLTLASAIVAQGAQEWLAHLEALPEAVAELPLTLLPATEHGAAWYAIELLVATSAQALAAVRTRRQLDHVLLEALLEDIAVIELAWLTLAGADRPHPSVAAAAAWEAYSRARPLRGMLVRAGFDTYSLPTETPDEARERATGMLDRLSGGFSETERNGIDEAAFGSW